MNPVTCTWINLREMIIKHLTSNSTKPISNLSSPSNEWWNFMNSQVAHQKTRICIFYVPFPQYKKPQFVAWLPSWSVFCSLMFTIGKLIMASQMFGIMLGIKEAAIRANLIARLSGWSSELCACRLASFTFLRRLRWAAKILHSCKILRPPEKQDDEIPQHLCKRLLVFFMAQIYPTFEYFGSFSGIRIYPHSSCFFIYGRGWRSPQ